MATDDYAVDLLRGYPRLAGIVTQLNQFLIQNHPNTFGSRQSHPVLRAKRSKVIHDNLWGTVRFTWRELALIDSPIIRRLRDIHQTGLAFNVYPSARHTRFEHSLGAVTIASRVFDALLHRQRNEVRDVVKVLWRDTDQDLSILPSVFFSFLVVCCLSLVLVAFLFESFVRCVCFFLALDISCQSSIASDPGVRPFLFPSFVLDLVSCGVRSLLDLLPPCPGAPASRAIFSPAYPPSA